MPCTTTSEVVASVIIPICNNYPAAIEGVHIALRQNYPAFEIILCDDSDRDYYISNRHELACLLKEECALLRHIYTARFDHEGNKDYGLARARNSGIVAARGKYLIFLDARLAFADSTAISTFVSALAGREHVWFFGDKGQQKSTFVENFSAIRRDEIIRAGMFCERVTGYGGMTREVALRFRHQGFALLYLPQARARVMTRKASGLKRDEEILRMKAMIADMYRDED